MSLPAGPTVPPSAPSASDDAGWAAWPARGRTLERGERWQLAGAVLALALILAIGVAGGVL